MSEPARKDDRHYTYADYYSWHDGERWELIDGVAYNMSPAPNRHHQGLVGEIFRKLADYVENKPCAVYVSPFDVRLPDSLLWEKRQRELSEIQQHHSADKNRPENHVSRPNSADNNHHAEQRSLPVASPKDEEITNVVQPDVSVFCHREFLDERGAVGPPDIAVEVLSPYTSVKDQREKLDLYEHFGVREYWIVDPANRVMRVYRLLTPQEGSTGTADTTAEGTTEGNVPMEGTACPPNMQADETASPAPATPPAPPTGGSERSVHSERPNHPGGPGYSNRPDQPDYNYGRTDRLGHYDTPANRYDHLAQPGGSEHYSQPTHRYRQTGAHGSPNRSEQSDYTNRCRWSGGYGRPEVFGPEDTVESRVLEGFSLKLSTLFTA